MDTELGKRIKRLREQRRWTQEQVGDALGVHPKTVSNWESGRNVPRSSLGALEKLFGDALTADSEILDPVEAAIRASELHEWRQDRVLSEYKRNLHEQRAEAAM